MRILYIHICPRRTIFFIWAFSFATRKKNEVKKREENNTGLFCTIPPKINLFRLLLSFFLTSFLLLQIWRVLFWSYSSWFWKKGNRWQWRYVFMFPSSIYPLFPLPQKRKLDLSFTSWYVRVIIGSVPWSLFQLFKLFKHCSCL